MTNIQDDKYGAYRFSVAREKMVRELVSRGLISSEGVIRAMEKVPRHMFVESAFQVHAYKDQSLPIGGHQTISQPSTVGIMTEQLDVHPEHRVLEVGTGSGYQTAILAELAGKVFTIERLPELSGKARAMLESLGYFTVRFLTGDGSLGWKELAPFHRIIVTAGAGDIPRELLEQLETGGRMVVPVGALNRQVILRIDKTPAGISVKEICHRNFVDLVGKYSAQASYAVMEDIS